MSLARVQSAALFGLHAVVVDVEVDVKKAEEASSLLIVGLPDTAVRESKDRVLMALYHTGLCKQLLGCTVNLAPGDVKKEGPLYDLAISLGILQALGSFPDSSLLTDYLIVGELGLSGTVRRVRGVLSVAMLARRLGKKGVVVPAANAYEAASVPGVEVLAVSTLFDAALFAKDPAQRKPLSIDVSQALLQEEKCGVDFADIRGQAHAKRALEVAAAGGHNVLFSGPPGSGKTLLAKALLGITPKMCIEEALETTRIHSVAGLLTEGAALVTKRPFRAPHHTISYAGLVGGGHIPRPGEVSLAHNGILFLDEVPEFSRMALEALRQPLEDGSITLSRAHGQHTFPSVCIFIAAMNPCPCGYLGHPDKACSCSPLQVQRYRSRLSGPLYDRIDMHIEVPALRYDELHGIRSSQVESSSAVRRRVCLARERQQERWKQAKTNSCMTREDLAKHCICSASCHEILRHAMDELGLSARACDRLLRVARTLADLEGALSLAEHHLMEALSFRMLG